MDGTSPQDHQSSLREAHAPDYRIEEVVQIVMQTPEMIQVKNALQRLVMIDHGTVLGKDMSIPDHRREVGMSWAKGISDEPSSAHRYHGHIEDIVRVAVRAAYTSPYSPHPSHSISPNQG